MRTSRFLRSKLGIFVVLLLVTVLSVLTLTACNKDNGTVVSIEVDPTTVEDYYVVGDFDVTSVSLVVTYDDDREAVINAQNSMLTTEAKNSLNTPGEKNITIAYKGQSIMIKFTLVEDEADIVEVTYRDTSGTILGTKRALKGGAVAEVNPPVVDGQTFVGWVDKDGKLVDMAKVSASMSVTASYSIKRDTYTLKFVDYKNNELSSGSAQAGSSISESRAPSVKLGDYPELQSFSWSMTFPFTINSDVTVKMVPEYKYASVIFEYAFENNPTATTRVDEYCGTVKYGTDVSSWKRGMENYLSGAGYEVATVPSEATSVKKDGVVQFLYIVRTASVNITVYNDKNRQTIVPFDSPMRLGTILTLPTTAASEPNKVLAGWQITGSNGSVTVDEDPYKWTVTNELGISLVIVPVYADLTVAVSFEFVFGDVKIANSSDTYKITLAINNEFKLNDSVSYAFIDTLLKGIAENEDKYLQVLQGVTVSGVYPASDNGSNVRRTALDSAVDCGIMSVVCGNTTIIPGGVKIIDKSGYKFTIVVSPETAGIVYQEVTGGYKVTGLGAAYKAGTNIFIPDEHGGKQVVEIEGADLAGKIITHLPSTIKVMGAGAFENATIYGDLSSEVLETIGQSAFKNATLVGSEINLPALTSVPQSAFESFKVKNADGTTANAVANFSAVTTVGKDAFKNSTGIDSFVFDAALTVVAESAFEGSGMKEITGVANLSTVGKKAFKGTELTSLALPGVTSLGEEAFANIEELITVSLSTEASGAAALDLDMDVFSGSVSLKSLTLGSGIKSFTGSDEVLASLEDLEEITVTENSKLYSDDGVLYSITGNSYTIIYYPNNKQGSYKATIPSGSTLNVNATAFENALVVVLDLSETSVGTLAQTTSNVYAVVINSAKTAEARSVFTGATVVDNPENANYGYDQTSGIIYKTETVNEVTTATVVGGNKKATEIVVPAKLGGFDVTKVSDGAFAGYTELESLTVNSVLDGWNATILDGCTSLVELNVKGFKNTYRAQTAHFAGNNWYNTHNVIYVGGIPVGYNNAAVRNGVAVTKVEAEDAGVYFASSGIPEGFFAGTNLKSIELPANVTIIQKNAFEGCMALTSFEAEGLTYVGEEAFKGCVGLKEIELNFTGTAGFMGTSVFENCSALTKATINGQVNKNMVEGTAYYYLPAKTFKNCVALNSVEKDFINMFGDIDGTSETFFGCSALKEFDLTTIKNERIPAKTFANSGLLYAVLTSSKLTTIGEEAFNNSSLQYVKLGSSVIKAEDEAFGGCNGIIIELSYDNNGFYSLNAEVSETAFPAETNFFISQSATSASQAFLTGKTYTSLYPIVSFRTTENTSAALNFLMTDITNSILITEEDVRENSYAGYTFGGWFMDTEETTMASFPLIISENTTLYAKYYNEKQGSLIPGTDTKYVYYLGSLPEVALDTDEEIVWTYTKNGMGSTVLNPNSLPMVLEAGKADVFTVTMQVIKRSNGAVVYAKTYDDLGTKGYAITGYSSVNAERISIPASGIYNDGTNGDDKIIVVYAGAFRNTISKNFSLPIYTKAIMTGYYYGNIDSWVNEGTFGADLENVTIPAEVEYIADGVFVGNNIKELTFAENSKLLYAKQEAFIGSEWWKQQIMSCADNNGFIMAGNLAVKFVGLAEKYSLPEGETSVVAETNMTFGFQETTEPVNMTFKLYMDDGRVLTSTDRLTATKYGDKVFVYTFAVTIGGMNLEGKFALNSIDSSSWAYMQGFNLLMVDEYPAGAMILSCYSVADTQVTLPQNTVKLNDSIFEGNENLLSVIINKELQYIGNRAFMNSGLAEIRYGTANNEQYISAICEIGKDAFTNCSWYDRETVLFGTFFLKYNNVSGVQSLIITENITRIMPNAFRGSTLNSVSLRSTTIKSIGEFAFKNSSIRSLTLPSGVEEIGRSAFEGCASLTSADFSVTAIKNLGINLFKGASSLTTLLLPNTLTVFDRGSLDGCERLSEITADGLVSLAIENGEFVSGLDDTYWYRFATESAAANTEDTALKLGKILVKYVLGTASKALYAESIEQTGVATLVITVPSDVEAIAYHAFYDTDISSALENITELNIPGSVTEIGDYAFVGLTGLQKVNFATGLLNIGEHAFEGLTNLTKADLPAGLKTIGASAFKNTSLTSAVVNEKGYIESDEGYTIPESVTSIGTQAFYGVKTLTSVNIGSKLIEIGQNAFAIGNGGNLYKINWTMSNATVVAPDGSRELGNIDKLANYLSANEVNLSNLFTTDAGLNIRFYVDDEVKAYIESMEFAHTTAWRVWSFYTKGTLPEVSFGNDGYTLAPINTEYIKDGDIDVPPHNTVAGQTYTFMYWTINGVNTEGSSIYAKLTYPYLVTSDITLYANYYENTLIASSSGVTEKDANDVTFYYSDANGDATITGFAPSTANDTLYVPDRISRSISDSSGTTTTYSSVKAFALLNAYLPNAENVKRLILTNASNFNGMKENIFEIFPNLETIEIFVSGSTKAGFKIVPYNLSATYDNKTYTNKFYAVYSNDTASTANYGTKLIAVIGNATAATEKARYDGYDGTDNLQFIFTIPEGVVEVYDNAMSNCGFTTVSIPSTLTKIGEDAFGASLTTLRIPRNSNIANVHISEATFYSINENAPIMNASAGNQTYGDGYIEIKGLKYKYANYGYYYVLGNILLGYVSNVREYLGTGNGLVLPNSVNGADITVLASELYRGYLNGTAWTASGVENSLVSDEITLPTAVQKINTDAFKYMNFSSVLNADNYANLRDIANKVFDDTDFYNDSTSSTGLYIGKVLVKWESAKEGQSTIRPDTVAISSNAFRGSSVKNITIPSTVVSIGENAFYGCIELTDVTISNSVTTIGVGAFMACNNLTTVNIDTANSMLTTIGNRAFANAGSLVTLNLPYRVNHIGSEAFSGCTKLTTITFDALDAETGEVNTSMLSRATEIGDSAFRGDTSLTAIKIPSGVKVIEDSTFENCKALVSLTFETNSQLDAIRSSAFRGCTVLGSEIDTNDLNLVTVTLPETLVTVENYAFQNCSGLWGIRFSHNIDVIGGNVFDGCNNLAKIEILRRTAPTITSNTFGNLRDKNYRLRIYVQGDQSGTYRTGYINKWNSVWADCGEYLYERGDLPKVYYRESGSSTKISDPVQADIIMNPMSNFGAGDIGAWSYLSFTQSIYTYTSPSEDALCATRITKSVGGYANQTKKIGGNDTIFLIVDYDEIVLVPTSSVIA